MSLDRFDNDFEHNVYGKIMQMTFDELADFLFIFYNKAWDDGEEGVTDERWVKEAYLYEGSLFPWENDC